MLKDAPGAGLLKVKPDAAHWYDREGRPMHSATLRDARKKSLLPSVTSILSVWPKPALEHYKIEQAVSAAMRLPRKQEETDKEFAARVVEEADQHRDAASAFGTRVHEMARAIAVLGHSEANYMDTDLFPFAQRFCIWFRCNVTHVLSAEKTVVCEKHGYAGTFDLIAETKDHGLAIIDFKTQGVKRDGPKFYDTWDFQLAAYQFAAEPDFFVESRVSIIINSKAPAPPIEKKWADEDGKTAFDKFLICNALWRAHRKYFP